MTFYAGKFVNLFYSVDTNTWKIYKEKIQDMKNEVEENTEPKLESAQFNSRR